MEQASTGFKDALRFGSNLYQARLTVYSGGNPTVFIVPVSDCVITEDRNSSQRRQGNITVELLPTVPPPPMLPTSPASILAPFGNEIFIEVALLTDPSQTPTEWIPLGLFAMATTVVEDSTIDLVVTIDVYDRSWVISQRTFLQPYNIPAASGNFVDEIEHLLNQVWGPTPQLLFNITPTDATVPTASYNEGSDPWQAAQDMATAVGYELFFDRHGIVVGYPIPDPTMQQPVWNFTEDDLTVQGTYNHPVGGTPYTTPVAVQVTFTRDRIYNDVIVSGTGSQNAAGAASGASAPVRAEAKDTNPASPTYVNGPVGDIPNFVQTNLATDVAVAQAMANNDLQAALSQAWQITVSTPPNPLFDVDDVVTVTRARLGLNGVRMVIDQIQTSIKYDATSEVTGRVVSA